MNINVKEVLVKAHNSISKVKRYHSLLQQTYKILSSELPSANKEAILQITVKAVNDLARPDGIMPTLLIFKAYSRITRDSPSSLFITEQAKAIHKAIKEV
jgi:hypothetical protein